MDNLPKRLRASIGCDAINGNAFERSVCAKQMREAAQMLDQLTVDNAALKRRAEQAEERIELVTAQVLKLEHERSAIKRTLKKAGVVAKSLAVGVHVMRKRLESVEARLAAIAAAPTLCEIVAVRDRPHIHMLTDAPPIGTELIARPAKDQS